MDESVKHLHSLTMPLRLSLILNMSLDSKNAPSNSSLGIVCACAGATLVFDAIKLYGLDFVLADILQQRML